MYYKYQNILNIFNIFKLFSIIDMSLVIIVRKDEQFAKLP